MITQTNPQNPEDKVLTQNQIASDKSLALVEL